MASLIGMTFMEPIGIYRRKSNCNQNITNALKKRESMNQRIDMRDIQRILQEIYNGTLSRLIYSGAKRAHYDTEPIYWYLLLME